MQACAKPIADDEMIFNLEEENVNDMSHSQSYSTQAVSSSPLRNEYLKETGSLKLKSKSPSRPLFRSLRLDRNVPIVLMTDKFIMKFSR